MFIYVAVYLGRGRERERGREGKREQERKKREQEGRKAGRKAGGKEGRKVGRKAKKQTYILRRILPMQNGVVLNNSVQRTKAMMMITPPDLPHNALFTDI